MHKAPGGTIEAGGFFFNLTKMKKFFEPITGILLSFISWSAFSDFLFSLFVAFLGGALAYLGKWACQRLIARFSKKNTVVDPNNID